MKRKILILLFLIPQLSLGETQVWVCIASFQSEETAQEYRTAAVYEFVDELSVVAAETPYGRSYRVLLGPYRDTVSAQRALEDARSSRPDAWLVNAQEHELTFLEPESRTESSFDLSEDEATNIELDHRPPAVDMGRVAAPEESELPPLSNVAPPGYNAHRLKRDSTDG